MSEATPAEQEEAPRPKRGRLMKASLWVFAAKAGQNVLRLGSNLVLTRLLFEEAFGLMALVNVFLTGLNLFSDFGIGPAVIRHERAEDERFLNTAWCVQITRGFVLLSICLVAAYPFSLFYEEPMLMPLVIVVGLSALLSNLGSTRLYEAQRQLRMRDIAVVELGMLLANIFTMVLFAYLYRSVWALAVGSIASSLTKVGLTHFWLSGTRNRIQWDPESAKELFSFGRWIFGSTAVTFLAGHTDRLIFGKLVPVDMLGVYHIGATLAGFPSAIMGMLADRILFPLTSQLKSKPEELRRVYGRSKRLFTTVSGWALCGFAAGGQTIIDLLFDDRYLEAGWMVQFLALGAWIEALQLSVRPLLLTLGDVQYLLVGNIARLGLMVLLIPLGYTYFDFPGAVAGLCASSLGNYAAFVWALRRSGFGGSWEDLGVTLFFLAVTTAGFLSAEYAAEFGAHVVVEALVVFVVVSAFWTPRFIALVRSFGGLKALLKK